jgi:hypothetical protein
MGAHQTRRLASEAVANVLSGMVKKKLDQRPRTQGRAIHCVLRDTVVELSHKVILLSSDLIKAISDHPN